MTDFLPALPAPTSMDDFLIHPFFKMDEHYPRSRSSTGSTRPVSIASPRDIIKLSLARKSSPTASSGSDHFYTDHHALMQWSYNSDEEAASPVARDDLSSTSSLSDEELPLADDDDLDDIDDEDDVEEIAELAIPIQIAQSPVRVEQHCRQAEAVRIVRAGRPKVIVLWKPPGSPVLVKRPASPTGLESFAARLTKSPKTAADDTASIRSREASTSSSTASLSEASSTLSKSDSTSSKASSTSSKAPSTSSKNSTSLTRSPATKKKPGNDNRAPEGRRPSLPVIPTKGNASWNPGVTTSKAPQTPQPARPTTSSTSKPSPLAASQNTSTPSKKTKKIPSPLNLKALTKTVRRKNTTLNNNDKQADPPMPSSPIVAPLSAAGPRRGSLSKLVPRAANARAPPVVLPAFVASKAIREDDEADLMHPGYSMKEGARRSSLASIPAAIDVVSKKTILYKSSENTPPSTTILDSST